MKQLFVLFAAAMLICANAFAQTPLTAPTSTNQALAEGNYILNGDLDFGANYYRAASGTVSIQLNGKTITGTSGSGLFRLDGASLAIDNNTTTGAINATTGIAIYNNSTGSVTISGGTVSTTTGSAIHNNSTGKITISQAEGKTTLITSAGLGATGTIRLTNSATANVLDITGGTVENTATGYAIYNNGTGSVTISGGTVSAVSGSAIYNFNTGKIAVSQAAGNITLITSANTSNSAGTIILTGAAPNDVLDITGGTVQNTASGNAIYNNSTGGSINISGGTVSAVSGTAIYNNSTGKITISQAAGNITLITSANTSSSMGTIYLTNSANANVLDITGGTVENTATGQAIYNYSTGNISISGGTVSATTGRAIYNFSTGNITISGGTVSATTGRAIYNYSTGNITISGGTVSASSGQAIYNYSTGKITISGGTVQNTATGYAIDNNGTGNITISGGTISATTGRAINNFSTGKISIGQAAGKTTLITSANTSSNTGTIYLRSGSVGIVVLDITGGTVQNTATGTAIYNDDTGNVSISGGTVSATTGTAIYNFSTGNVSISGGTVSASSGQAIYNFSTGNVTISGGTVSASSGQAIYNFITGNVTISGGTVSASSGQAIYNFITGKITISGSALVTSANATSNQGTIHLATFTTTTFVLEITGGIVQNTATPEGYSVYYSDAAITYPLLTDVYSHTGGTVGRVYPHPYLLTVVQGVGIAATTPATGLQVANEEVEITATAATGYTFSTWTVTDGASGSFDSETSATTTYTMPNDAATIQANATANSDVSYTVNYIQQGTATELATAKTVTAKTFDETYSEDAIAIIGYTVVSASSQTITLDAYGKTLTFEYTVNRYTVTFATDEGSLVDSQSIDYNTLATQPTDPTKEGYTFDGWYKNTEFVEVWDFDTDVVTGDMTLYAKWTLNTYIVTFAQPTNGTLVVKAGDVELTSGTAVSHGTVLTITATPTEGYSVESLKVNGVEHSGSYTVTAETTIEVVFKVVTGILDMKVTALKLYPNPATTILNIDLTATDISTTDIERSRNVQSVEIFDITGKLVLQVPAAAVIDISTLPQGTYIVKVGSYRGKVLKQ